MTDRLDGRGEANRRLIQTASEAMRRADRPGINSRLMQAMYKAAQRGVLTRPDVERMAGTASSVVTD